MSNPFKYFKDKVEIWAVMEKPKSNDYYKPMDDTFTKEVEYDARPHFPVSPEPDWEDGKIVYEGKDYIIYYGGLDDKDYSIAIPLPKEKVKNETMNIDKIGYLESIMEKFGEAHTLLARTNLPKEQYNPISSLLAHAKIELFTFYSAMKKEFPEQQDIPMEKDGWVTEKPAITKDCIMLVATWWKDHWETTAFDIIAADGEDDDGKPCWYWSVLEHGDEWGDLDDIHGQCYKIIHFPQSPKEEKES